MIMASLVDAGVSLEALRGQLGKLPLEGWTISAREVRKGAFRATKVDVEVDPHAHRQHRSLRDILDILERSSLEPSVKGRVARIFTRTGAAILTTLAASAGRMPSLTVEAVGYGAGTMDLPGTPNILRCFLGATANDATGDETVLQVETTIDDMSPQLYEPLIERLFGAGALDVFLQPVIMKRGRPGIVVTALCAPDRVSDLSRALFEESTTIGVRWSEWRRARLDREVVVLTTAYGAIPFKVSRLGGRVGTVTPAFAHVARIGREKSLPAREVLEQARADGRRPLGQ